MNSNFLIFNLSSCFIFVWIRGACPTDGDRARALKRTHVPSQSRKCPKCNCIFPFKCKTPPPLFWNIFFVPLLALLALLALCLNIINIFKMPEKKRLVGLKIQEKSLRKKIILTFFIEVFLDLLSFPNWKKAFIKHVCVQSEWAGFLILRILK